MQGTAPTAWGAPPARPELAEGEAHAWLADLDQTPERVRALGRVLSGDELARAERFRFPRDRDHFVVSRAVLRLLLGAYLGAPPAGLRFRYGARGKPSLAEESNRGGLRFNVSHSHGLALFGFTRRAEVGIDLERVSGRLAGEQIAERFFAPREVRALRALPRAVQDEAFFHCWTRKEAFVKARGDGLSLPLELFEVTLAPGAPAALLSTAFDPPEAARWAMRELRPAPGYVGALVVEGGIGRLECWSWETVSRRKA